MSSDDTNITNQTNSTNNTNNTNNTNSTNKNNNNTTNIVIAASNINSGDSKRSRESAELHAARTALQECSELLESLERHIRTSFPRYAAHLDAALCMSYRAMYGRCGCDRPSGHEDCDALAEEGTLSDEADYELSLMRQQLEYPY